MATDDARSQLGVGVVDAGVDDREADTVPIQAERVEKTQVARSGQRALRGVIAGDDLADASSSRAACGLELQPQHRREVLQ